MEIELENLNLVYTDNATYIKPILSDINISIKPGKINVLVGTYKSGKTTILKLISGLILPTSGKINIKNTEFPYEKMGLIYSENEFIFKTVYEELSYAIKHLNKKVTDIHKHVISSLNMVGLNENYLNRKITTLSDSERIKISLALVLGINSKIILIDEIDTILDPKSLNEIIKLLNLLKKRYNKTIVISTRNTSLAHMIADNVILLSDGKIVESGNKYDIFTKDLSKYGLKNPNIIEFENMARKKGVRLLYRDEINDLMKDIYRYCR